MITGVDAAIGKHTFGTSCQLKSIVKHRIVEAG